MAEAVLFNIADGIITKLGSLAIKEFALWWGVNDEMEKLKSTVLTIKNVLLDSEKQSLQSDQIKGWLGDLKEAVYDADDLLDDFSTEVLRRQVMGGNKMARKVRLFFSSSNKLACGFKMAHRIKEIRARLDLIAESRKFHLVQQPLETIVMAKDREQTHSSLPQLVVGRENDKNEIIELLLSSYYEVNVSIISIVGIGGLGKTTLAQMICNDEGIKLHFDLKIWVCISDDFDVKLIVEKILESVTSQKPMDNLKNMLHEKLSGKRYLIVLDDVWNEDTEKWFRLSDLLVVGARGSKILITTRLQKVAQIVRSTLIHELKGLSDAESWFLFEKLAFKSGQVPSLSHKAIGKEIVTKCAGVPLAIKTIGSLLLFKETELEWLSFKNVELSSIDQNDNDILPTLKLSYNHLPSHLKHCFAYCKLFPKDHKIDVETLIYLWMAQGYIKPSNSSQSLEDIGMEYFKELAWRSFFQEIKKDFFGNIWECKMHDLMHEMAMQVGGEESVLIEAGAEYANNNEKARHISFDVTNSTSSLQQFLSTSLDRKKLRTLLLLNTQWSSVTIEEVECNLIFSNLRCLRVLDLHVASLKAVPQSSISKLEHLRYLDLSYNTGIEMLPNSITRLQNLQVLKLTGCWKLKQLPKDMKKLVNLRQLQILGCNSLTHMPRGLGQLSCLQELTRFVVADQDNPVYKYSSGLGELHGLNNLRGELDIVNLQYVKKAASEFKAANLKDKHRLQSLALSWKSEAYDVDEDVEGGGYEMSLEELRPHVNLKGLVLNGCGRMKFPSWLSSLANLVIINIRNFNKCQHLPPLQQFPCLKTLAIYGLTNLEYIDCEVINCDEKGESASSFFPPLKSVSLYNCPNLKRWRRKSTVEVEAELPQFPCLSNLKIDSCPNLISTPPFPSLKYLTLGKSSVKLLEPIMKKTVSVAESSSSSSLKDLFIRNIDDLELVSLPVDLLKIITVINLYIWDCPNLISLPDWMCNLNVSTLSISGCPQLSERCNNNNMAGDWPKIAHIPTIRIDDKLIQENGHYKL